MVQRPGTVVPCPWALGAPASSPGLRPLGHHTWDVGMAAGSGLEGLLVSGELMEASLPDGSTSNLAKETGFLFRDDALAHECGSVRVHECTHMPRRQRPVCRSFLSWECESFSSSQNATRARLRCLHPGLPSTSHIVGAQ